MALTSLADLSIIDANNTSFSGISQAENVMKPSDVNDSLRATDGSIARYLSDLAGINQTVGGTANAITVTVAQTWTALANGQRFAIKNTVGPNTGATTIAVTNSVAGALGTKAIRLQGDSALVGGEMLANGLYEFRYDTSYNAAAGAWVLLNPAVSSSNLTSNAPFINLSLVASVAASALTVAIKGVDGNDPSASNPVTVNFRSATAGSGAVAQLTLTAATSIVVSSGSTLGSTSAVAATYALAVFNDAGTARMAIINPLTLPLVDGIASATAEGGAGAADSAGVWYSNAAITSKAYTIVGYIIVTEATAGTWATAPSAVQVATSAVVSNVVPYVTPLVAYTPTFTGFGTATNISFFSKRIGDLLYVEGKFSVGTPTATEARITIGFNGTSGNVTVDPTKLASIRICGKMGTDLAAAADNVALGEASVSYMTFGQSSSGTASLTKSNGNALAISSTVISLFASFPIQGW